MEWTDRHACILGQAFAKVLGCPKPGSMAFAEVLGLPEPGSMAFVRCLLPEVVHSLAGDASFAPQDWQVLCVAAEDNEDARTITADRAVEMRETKKDATLLLVDTDKAGAGMDGIYSAAREVDEESLFKEALSAAKSEVTNQLSRTDRDYAERAVRKARDRGRYSVSLWTEFDFFCRIAADKRHPGAYLHLLGLWPVQTEDEVAEELNVSRMFVERLLGTQVASLTPAKRIESLRLQPCEQLRDLEGFLRQSDTQPLLSALAELAKQKHLWVNALPLEDAAQEILSIELSPWRTSAGKIARWSGLHERDDHDPHDPPPPELILKPDVEQASDYSNLEVKWKARPENLKEGAAEYRVAITTDMDEELATREVVHSAKREEKCRFNNDDFTDLSEDALIPAKVVVSVLGDKQPKIEPVESEDFMIRFGDPPSIQLGGGGKTVRTFSEGLIELDSREMVSELVSATVSTRKPLSVDAKGCVQLRTPQRKTLRVFQPPLLKEVEKKWALSNGAIGRWVVKVRASGDRSGAVVPIALSAPAAEGERVKEASRKMADRFARSGGGVGQVYDEKTDFTTVREYLLAWAALLEKGDPCLALANTVEVQSLSGDTIGLIVLPSHPLRVAWHVAYDNLVLHAKFEQGMTPKEIREELSSLDGAMFPAFLPGVKSGTSFVFADTLGFHALGMVRDDDKEPKAALAVLARTIGASETADAAPTVGEQSATVLGTEIVKYLECHNTPRRTARLLHIHALRAGDGLTMARALGHVHKRYRSISDEEDLDEDPQETAPAFVLELYPSAKQRGRAGQFIADAREKRRRGAGVLSPDDHWMLESLRRPGGVSLPRLQWARKSEQDPRTAAHLAIAFDTFASQVMPADPQISRPLYAFGLLSFFERTYDVNSSFPLWHSIIPPAKEGEKHPSDRSHTERLTRLQDAIQRAVARHMDAEGKLPTLRTEISADKEKSLGELHSLCDWVITLDRNAGIEYFDSPQDNKHIYDAYVIDCVPEREDLGCLQLITSTNNLEDMQALLDDVLKQMGIASGRNAAFLIQHLKALSGQFTLRLSGSKAATAQLVALAASYANCRQPSASSDSWLSLERGFLIPIDEVHDLLPPLKPAGNEDENEAQPDFIYVSRAPRKGLRFQFIKVKYRRHLRAARGPEILQGIDKQVQSLRKGWASWYGQDDVCSSFRALRRAKLARVLRFYADKAHRHGLPQKEHEAILSEIERMIERGGDYPFVEIAEGDRGWIFCPEYAGADPLEISPDGWNTRIFLFGPGLLPDSDVYPESIARSPAGGSPSPGQSDQESKDGTDSVEKTADKEPSICLGKDTLTGGEVHWTLTTKGNPHLLVAGLPGMGKTTCLLNLCQQMVAAGVRPIVFSYHEDIDERLEQLGESVRFIDFQGLGFNPLQVIDRESRTAYLDVAGALRDIFISIFPELGDIQGERIRRAIKESFIEMGWDDPNADVAGLQEPEFKRFVEILQADPKPDRGLRTLLARLAELKDYSFFDLQESRTSLWESEQPTVIRIHTTQNDNLQKAFASLIFYGLYKDMFRRGVQDRITHAVIFDEAHRAAGLKLIPTMAKECRKYGISLVLASQEARDFNDSLFSAIANYLVLRLTEADAKALVRKVASSQRERSEIDKIKQMDRFKALYFCEGKRRPSAVDLLPLDG